MRETLQGKIIVRPTAKSNNKPALFIFGVLEYSGNIEDIDKADEMWVVNLTIEESIKFKGGKENGSWNLSVEDIMTRFSYYLNPKNWKRK